MRRGRLLFVGVLWLCLHREVGGQTPVLPPWTPPEDTNRLSRAAAVYVYRYEFKGNTAFTDDELRGVLLPYAGRKIDSADLEAARRTLTLHYVRHGYLNSGAILEDQDATSGVITFTVIEGRLSGIEVSGTRRFRPWFLEAMLGHYGNAPVNLGRLQEGLFELKGDPNIRKINAELKPGAVPGVAALEVRVEENSPWHLGVEFRNDRPPSVGSEVLEVRAGHGNVLGFGDELSLRYGIAHGADDGVELSELKNWGVAYATPMNARGTTLRMFYDKSDFTVIEEPFAQLDVTSRSRSFGATLRHPLHRSARREIASGLTMERRESDTFLMGERFSFTDNSDGRTRETVLRIFQEWIERRQSQVFALRSTFNWGVDLWAPRPTGDEPDALFLSWQGQGQYIRRLGKSQTQLVLNTVLQWSDDSLLSLEQFSLGGGSNVRGYRENQVVRDMGWLISAELRWPILQSAIGAPWVQLAPFADFGLGWNARGETPEQSEIGSAGLGLLLTPHRRIDARLYWGYAFREFTHDDTDLQDHGLHFRVNLKLF